jgi:hypothetical protein
MQRMTRACKHFLSEVTAAPTPYPCQYLKNPRPCKKLPEQSFVTLLVFYWFRHEQEIKIVESFSLSAYTIMDYIFHLTIKILLSYDRCNVLWLHKTAGSWVFPGELPAQG